MEAGVSIWWEECLVSWGNPGFPYPDDAEGILVGYRVSGNFTEDRLLYNNGKKECVELARTHINHGSFVPVPEPHVHDEALNLSSRRREELAR